MPIRVARPSYYDVSTTTAPDIMPSMSFSVEQTNDGLVLNATPRSGDNGAIDATLGSGNYGGQWDGFEGTYHTHPAPGTGLIVAVDLSTIPAGFGWSMSLGGHSQVQGSSDPADQPHSVGLGIDGAGNGTFVWSGYPIPRQAPDNRYGEQDIYAGGEIQIGAVARKKWWFGLIYEGDGYWGLHAGDTRSAMVLMTGTVAGSEFHMDLRPSVDYHFDRPLLLNQPTRTLRPINLDEFIAGAGLTTGGAADGSPAGSVVVTHWEVGGYDPGPSWTFAVAIEGEGWHPTSPRNAVIWPLDWEMDELAGWSDTYDHIKL